MDENKAVNKYRPYIIILIAVILAEIFIFNWRFIEGIGYEKTELTSYTCGSGITYVNRNEIGVKPSGDKWIEFKGFDAPVENVYISISNKRNYDDESLKEGGDYAYKRLAVVLSITDEANAQYLDMPERYIVDGVERTKYLKLHTAGNSDSLKIRFNGVDNQNLIIEEVSLNKQVPFSVNIFRMIFVFIVLWLGYILRYGSPVYNIKFKYAAYGQLWITILVVIINIALAGLVGLTNPKFQNPGWEHHKQYNYLADSFNNGHVYLDYAEPPQALIDMENPYDKNERNRVMREKGAGYKWDHAYYEGKYYVYFGALPVLTYYLPYKNLTGEEFMTYAGVFINAVIFIIFAFMLMNKVIKRWFKDIPFVSYLLLTEVLVASSGIIFSLRKPDIYAMPISMALMLVTVGLYFWISAWDCRLKLTKTIQLLIGSLCMALVAGCRPQFLIASFLAIPLFWRTVFKDRELFSKKSIGASIAFVLPYVIVAAVVMWYNYARFGSVFDFGANYNLTTNDMTRRGFEFGRIPFGIFCYFLQLPVTYSKFPFITGTNLSNWYMGTSIMEMMLGGILATQPVLWILALTKWLKAELKDKGLFAFVICGCIFSVVVAIADTQMAGILYRYYADFTYLMFIPAILVALTLLEKLDKKYVAFSITALCSLSLAYDFALLFVQGDYYHDLTNPDFYYSITSALTFWL